MAKTVGDFKIPFDADGNQLHYEGYGKVDWRPNDPFQDTLTFEGFSRGRSAAYLRFKRSDGADVVVFLKDFAEMVPHMVHGKVTGTFRHIKRGTNFGTTMMAGL